MNNTNNNNSEQEVVTNLRLAQLHDENDHKRCSEGNRQALLQETLMSLRRLTQDLQQDDWMYSEKKIDSNKSIR